MSEDTPGIEAPEPRDAPEPQDTPPIPKGIVTVHSRGNTHTLDLVTAPEPATVAHSLEVADVKVGIFKRVSLDGEVIKDPGKTRVRKSGSQIIVGGKVGNG
jgi:hypothetical protein